MPKMLNAQSFAAVDYAKGPNAKILRWEDSLEAG